MNWVVVLTLDTPLAGQGVRTFGPYATEELAEAARRRIHFDEIASLPIWQTAGRRTFTAEMETER